MSWIEIEGATREEAEKKALEVLEADNLDSIDIEEVKVVRKFLGMGGKTHKIRVRIKGDGEPTVNIIDMINEASHDKDSDPLANLDEEVAVVEAITPKTKEIAEEDKIVVPDGVVTLESKYRPWAAEGPEGIYVPKKGRGYRRRLYSVTAPEDQEEAPVAAAKKGRQPRKERDLPVEEVVEEEFEAPEYSDAEDSGIDEETREQGVNFVSSVINDMGLAGDVKGFRLVDRLLIHVDSEESGGLLIGRRGETLESLQYLTDIVINRSREHRVRVIVDTEHYRERRRFKIVLQAKQAANDATRSRKSISLPPMSPSERRVAHMTLADDKRVTTVSEGEGARRRVVIQPAGAKPHGGKGKGKGKGNYNRPRKR